MKRRPTQSDVAKLAGVSRSTVSYVLNQQGDTPITISNETRQRVLKAVQELGYAPDPVAQMLAQGSRRLMGVFTYETEFPYEGQDFYHQFLVGIEREAGQQGYNVVLFTRRDHDVRRIFADGANSLRLADGAILLGAVPDRDELKRLIEEEYPFVFIGRREVPGCEISWVASDYFNASVEATRHLVELGHRRLGLITHAAINEADQDKIAGCENALSDTSDAELFAISIGDIRDASGFKETLRKLGLTAVMTADQNLMQDVSAYCHELTIAVPRDLSLVALVNTPPDPISGAVYTQVNINRHVVGEVATRALLARLTTSTAQTQQIRVPCEFVPGETTAPRRDTAAG